MQSIEPRNAGRHVSERDLDNLTLSVDPSNGIPIWLQLRNQIIFHINARHYTPGFRLPTVREMAVDLGINYNTVGKVYQGLERDGYIVSLRGKGTFVSDKLPNDEGGPIEQSACLAAEFVRQCRELGMSDSAIADLVDRTLCETAND